MYIRKCYTTIHFSNWAGLGLCTDFCTRDWHFGAELKKIGSSILQSLMTHENIIFLVSIEIRLTLERNSDPRIQSSFISSNLYKVKVSLVPLSLVGKLLDFAT